MDIQTLEDERKRAIQAQGDLRMGVSGGWNVAKNMRSSPYADFEPYDEEDEWGFGVEDDGQGFFYPIPRIPFDERVQNPETNDMMIAGAPYSLNPQRIMLPNGRMEYAPLNLRSDEQKERQHMMIYGGKWDKPIR
tara:strand:+ start:61 stop:465 length:405 start_codon:yes stop_codon:yes gene_type:complete